MRCAVIGGGAWGSAPSLGLLGRNPATHNVTLLNQLRFLMLKQQSNSHLNGASLSKPDLIDQPAIIGIAVAYGEMLITRAPPNQDK